MSGMTSTGTIFELSYSSSTTQRYDGDDNDRVGLHIEQSGTRIRTESGASDLSKPFDDPTGAVNVFEVECDAATAERLGREISVLLGGRKVIVEAIAHG